MKIQQAIQLFKLGKLGSVEIMHNPSDSRQWFVMVRQTDGRSFMLADGNDNPVVDDDLERLFDLMKAIGFREAIVVF